MTTPTAQCASCEAHKAALAEGAQRYIRLRKHILRRAGEITNKLARLNTTHPEDWKILTQVRDLLDDLDQVKNWEFEEETDK